MSASAPLVLPKVPPGLVVLVQAVYATSAAATETVLRLGATRPSLPDLPLLRLVLAAGGVAERVPAGFVLLDGEAVVATASGLPVGTHSITCALYGKILEGPQRPPVGDL